MFMIKTKKEGIGWGMEKMVFKLQTAYSSYKGRAVNPSHLKYGHNIES